MKPVSIKSAHEFVEKVKIPRPTRARRRAGAMRAGAGPADTVELKLDETKDQAAIVGSSVISFVTGVNTARREAIANSALLAQLVAKKKVADPEDMKGMKKWYEAYFDSLSNLGWVIQERSFQEYHEDHTSFHAHKAIIAVATTLLGGGTTALVLVTSILTNLQKMEEDSPWITVFNRESRKARAAHFQIGLAQQDPGGDFFVELMAFAMEAESKLTQVLFFKATASEVDLTHYSGRVTINTAVLDGVGPAIKLKLMALANEYIKGLPDLT